jgi:acetyl-CoA acetyltransferase
MLNLAAELVRSGVCSHVLVIAGENRLSGQSRDRSLQTLAQVGHPFEVRNGASVPSYYALMASRYFHLTNTTEEDVADLAVLMRRHAGTHPDAHLRTPITAAEVLGSKPVSLPLKILDCCPISDGAVALIVSRSAGSQPLVRIAGSGQAHHHQHLSAMADVMDTGAASSAARAFAEAKMTMADIDLLAIYDSFTITLAMLLEEIGFAPRGQAGTLAREGVFGATGKLPLNLHGGLLSFGHSGVAGGMAHVVEAVRQLRGDAGSRTVPGLARALIHADGGIMSAHVSIVLERVR